MAMIWVWTLTTLLLTGLFLAGFSARKCPAGWRPWVCYQIAALQTTIFCRWQANNYCPIPESGPAIIVANHTSPVDPAILWRRHFANFSHRHLRVVGFMMAREYYLLAGPVGWACRSMQCIPVGRDGRDMAPVKEALERLKQGKLLGLFPEGRINAETPDSQLLPGGTGVAWLALKSKVPLIPVFIHCGPRSDSMVRVFFKFTRTRVTYGQPMDLSRWHDVKLSHDVLAEVTDLIMSEIAKLGGIRHTPVSKSNGASKSDPSACDRES